MTASANRSYGPHMGPRGMQPRYPASQWDLASCGIGIGIGIRANDLWA
jgi:hypothetical protein